MICNFDPCTDNLAPQPLSPAPHHQSISPQHPPSLSISMGPPTQLPSAPPLIQNMGDGLAGLQMEPGYARFRNLTYTEWSQELWSQYQSSGSGVGSGSSGSGEVATSTGSESAAGEVDTSTGSDDGSASSEGDMTTSSSSTSGAEYGDGGPSPTIGKAKFCQA